MHIICNEFQPFDCVLVELNGSLQFYRQHTFNGVLQVIQPFDRQKRFDFFFPRRTKDVFVGRNASAV
jgi:hypothetical protein